MKKLILLSAAVLTVGLLTSNSAQAAPHGKGVQVHHMQKANHKGHHKHHGKHHRHKNG